MARLRITYRDDRQPDELTLGAFSQIAGKRRYGLEVLKTEDPEPVYFSAFVELVGPARAKRPAPKPDDPEPPDPFDDWLLTVAGLEILDPEDPTPAETPSTDGSPESPPTSE